MVMRTQRASLLAFSFCKAYRHKDFPQLGKTPAFTTPPTMTLRPIAIPCLSTLAILFLAALQVVLAHRIDLPASKKDCFFEDLHVNDKVRE